MCDVRQLIAACSREIRGLTESSRRNGSFSEGVRSPIGAAERFVAVDLQRKPLFRPICGHFVLVPHSIVPSGFAAWLRSQVKNIRFGGKHLLYQNEVVHFRIRLLS